MYICTYVYTWLAGTSDYMHSAHAYNDCKSIRRIAKDILNSKAGEERLATLHSIMFSVVLARHYVFKQL